MSKQLFKLIGVLLARRATTRRAPGASRSVGRSRMRRPAGIAGIITAILAAVVGFWNKGADGTPDSADSRRAKEAMEKLPEFALVTVSRVVDGDTLEVLVDGRKIRVRMLGIDAMDEHEESKSEGQSEALGLPESAIKDLARKATGALHAAVGDSQISLVNEGGARKLDPHGRILAYVECGGRDLAEDLLLAGLAEARREAHPRSDRYKQLERQARTARIGIWRNER